jgi:hypothetical protein
MGYDTELFITIVLQEGARKIDDKKIGSEEFIVCIGPSGKKVLISVSDELTTTGMVATYLRQLGMESLRNELLPIANQRDDGSTD